MLNIIYNSLQELEYLIHDDVSVVQFIKCIKGEGTSNIQSKKNS